MARTLKIIFFIVLLKTHLALAQMFIPYTNWNCKNTYTNESTSVAADFNLGTYSNTNISGNSVVLSVGQSTGTYTSKVYDIFGGCIPLLPWLRLEWDTTLPYGKEIPATSETAVDYSAITASLTTNLVELLHFNGSGAIANAAAIAAAVGTSGTASNANAAGMTYTASGKLNSAITFDGTDDYVDIAYTQTAVSDYSISAWFKTSNGGNNVILQDRGGGAGSSLTLGIGNNPGGCAAGKISYGLDSNTIYIGKCTSSAYNDGNWHHVLAVWDGTSGVAVAATQFTIYVDGTAAATSSVTVGTPPNAPLTGLGNTKIGRHDAWGVNYNGSIDEVAVWTRPIGATEAQQIFRRGGNRVKFQLKSCTLSNCSDIATWKGPDNTNATYFTEINNNGIQSTGLGNVLTTSPVMLFSNFPSLSIPTNRFFQYQATLESDNTAYQPEFISTLIYRGCVSGSTTISVSGTWQLPAGCTSFTATANGGGGASAAMTGGTKALGGNGGQAVKSFSNQPANTIYTVTIGAGGQCSRTAGTGAYAGGTGGTANACSAGTAGAGTGTGGTGGTKAGAGCLGGAGKYGGGGGGGGASGSLFGAGGGGATSLSFSGVDYLVAGGGGGAGAADQGAGGVGGAACSLSSGYNGGNAGNGVGGDAGGGGGGGGCYCLGGTCNANPTSGGGAGGASNGMGCNGANNGTAGSITIAWP